MSKMSNKSKTTKTTKTKTYEDQNNKEHLGGGDEDVDVEDDVEDVDVDVDVEEDEGDEDEFEDIDSEDVIEYNDEEVEFTTTGEQLEDLDLQVGDCDFEDLEGIYTDEPPHINTIASIKTTPYITKYELVKVKGLRVQMLEKHAPPTVEPELFPGGKYPNDTEAIALMELYHKRLPFIINRLLPNGQHLSIPVSQLLIRDNLVQ